MLKELRKEPWVWAEQFCASLLANKATLERHKKKEKVEWSQCEGCSMYSFPCPTLLDVTNQLDKVMG